MLRMGTPVVPPRNPHLSSATLGVEYHWGPRDEVAGGDAGMKPA